MDNIPNSNEKKTVTRRGFFAGAAALFGAGVSNSHASPTEVSGDALAAPSAPESEAAIAVGEYTRAFNNYIQSTNALKSTLDSAFREESMQDITWSEFQDVYDKWGTMQHRMQELLNRMQVLKDIIKSDGVDPDNLMQEIEDKESKYIDHYKDVTSYTIERLNIALSYLQTHEETVVFGADIPEIEKIIAEMSATDFI